MPLKKLNIRETGVTDISILKDMPLTALSFTPAKIRRGMEELRNIKTLKNIQVENYKWLSPDEFWKKYDAGEIK